MTLTWKPSCFRVWVARSTDIPFTLGTPTVCGPFEMLMVITWPGVKAPPGAGDCWVIVPCGWVLLASATSFSETRFCCAHCSATDFCWPTKLGTGGPALTAIATGLGCGQEVPAAGFVLITIPAGIVAEVSLLTGPGTSPAFLSAVCAAACVPPGTGG